MSEVIMQGMWGDMSHQHAWNVAKTASYCCCFWLKQLLLWVPATSTAVAPDVCYNLPGPLKPAGISKTCQYTVCPAGPVGKQQS